MAPPPDWCPEAGADERPRLVWPPRRGASRAGGSYVWTAYGVTWTGAGALRLESLGFAARGRSRTVDGPQTHHLARSRRRCSSPAAALAFIAFGDMGKNLVYYWTPAEMLAAGQQGLRAPPSAWAAIVQRGSHRLGRGPHRAHLPGGRRHDAQPRRALGAGQCARRPPQMFREGIGVVVEGTFDKSPGLHLQPADGEPLQRVPAAQARRGSTSWKDTLVLRHHLRGEAEVRGTLGYAFVLGGLLVRRLRRGGGPRGRPAPRARAPGSGWSGPPPASSLCMLGANLTMVWALVAHDFSVHYVAQVGSRGHAARLHRGLAVERARGLASSSGAPSSASTSSPSPGRSERLAGAQPSSSRSGRCWVRRPSSPSSSPVRPTPSGRCSPGPARRPGAEPAPAEPHPDGHPPADALLRLRGHDDPLRHRRARRCSRAAWARPGSTALRRWTLLAWTFLTVGIILGGWWAYEVLGWGGYWAWDPVENASFLPWLTATAFLHSTMLQERQARPEAVDAVAWRWPASCSPSSGTFMTRSGHLQLRPLLHPVATSAPPSSSSSAWCWWSPSSCSPCAGRCWRRRTAARGGLARDGHPGEQPALRRAHLHHPPRARSSRWCARPSAACAMSVGAPYFNRMAMPLGHRHPLPDGRRARRSPGGAPTPATLAAPVPDSRGGGPGRAGRSACWPGCAAGRRSPPSRSAASSRR